MEITRRELLIGAAALGLTGAAGDPLREVRAFLEAEQLAGVFPGMALAVSRDNRQRFESYYGTYCALGHRDAAIRAHVLHPLYSYSKLVSATVVMMAVEDRLVALDTPVKSYISEFTGGGKDAITLRHLLTHSAGIPAVPLGAARTEEQWKQAVAVACAAKTDWEPGSRTAYHALSGLFVAAECVRRKQGGKPWDAICRERLFAPIGAHSLTFALPADDAPVALTPQPKELPKTLADHFQYAGHPAGGCLGTAADALKVLELHLHGGVWRGKRLLKQETLAEMHRVQYQKQIDEARAAGKAPTHEPWGLGPLMRGPGPKAGGHDWFGFRDQASPGIFGHAGIDTVIGVADPVGKRALMFITTQSPPTSPKTVELRNGVVNRAFAALEKP
ncbi:MAG: serine hydrolase domain-containing protein [Actinomycetota bacterium]